VTSPKLTDTDEYALDVSSFNLTDEEASATVDYYTPKPEEE
jgi:hypothetical protein